MMMKRVMERALSSSATKSQFSLNKAFALQRSSPLLAQHPAMSMSMSFRLNSMRTSTSLYSVSRRAFAEGAGPEETGGPGASDAPQDPTMAGQPSYIKEMKSTRDW